MPPARDLPRWRQKYEPLLKLRSAVAAIHLNHARWSPENHRGWYARCVESLRLLADELGLDPADLDRLALIDGGGDDAA